MCLCNLRSGFVGLGMASWSGRPVVLVAGNTGPAKEGLTMGWTTALSLEEEPLGYLDLCDTSGPDFPLASWSCQSWLWRFLTRARREGRRGELSSVPEIPTTDRSLPCRSQHCRPIACQKPSSLFLGRDRFDFCRFQNRNQMGPPLSGRSARRSSDSVSYVGIQKFCSLQDFSQQLQERRRKAG